MAAIAGYNGTVVYGSGWVTNVHQWRVVNSTTAVDNTTFRPTGNSRTRRAAIGNWEGEYRCHQAVTVNTTVGILAGYVTNVHSFSVNVVAEDLLTTVFGASWNTRISGLLSATGSYDCYVDDSVVLPVHGGADTLTLTIDAGLTLVLPVLIVSCEVRVGTDGSDRHVTMGWESDGDFAETGIPIIATTGPAEFIAEGGRQYSGDILVTGIDITGTAERDTAEWTITFVGNGAPANA